MRGLYRTLFRAACAVGRPIGGLRPRRIYHWLAERGFDRDHIELAWHRDRWGNELLLSPYYFIDRHILAFGCYDAPLHDYLEAHLEPRMVCIDVGANLGEVALQMARLVGPDGRVYAFEPVGYVRERLRAHVARNGYEGTVEVREEALLDREGPAEIRASLPTAANQGRASLIDDENAFLTQRLPVHTTTLDRFVAEQAPPRIDLVKIDIQGSEPRMIRGAERCFERFGPDILMEVAPWELRFEQMTGGDLIRQMQDLGYQAYAIDGSQVRERVTPESLPEAGPARNLLFTKKRLH